MPNCSSSGSGSMTTTDARTASSGQSKTWSNRRGVSQAILPCIERSPVCGSSDGVPAVGVSSLECYRHRSVQDLNAQTEQWSINHFKMRPEAGSRS